MQVTVLCRVLFLQWSIVAPQSKIHRYTYQTLARLPEYWSQLSETLPNHRTKPNWTKHGHKTGDIGPSYHLEQTVTHICTFIVTYTSPYPERHPPPGSGLGFAIGSGNHMCTQSFAL